MITRIKTLSQSNPLWLAYLIHRLSGIGLALFLPLHFWVLSLALRNQSQLESVLRFTDTLPVKLAEFGLVFLLAAHCFGGIRLLALEWLPWNGKQKTLAAAVFAIALAIATLFLLQAL